MDLSFFFADRPYAIETAPTCTLLSKNAVHCNLTFFANLYASVVSLTKNGKFRLKMSLKR